MAKQITDKSLLAEVRVSYESTMVVVNRAWELMHSRCPGMKEAGAMDYLWVSEEFQPLYDYLTDPDNQPSQGGERTANTYLKQFIVKHRRIVRELNAMIDELNG